MPRSVRRVLMGAVISVLFVLLLGAVALAQTPDDKLRAGDTVTVETGETVAHDLYAFGGNVTIAGTVDGDLIATGGAVDIPGDVTGDVLAAGGTVTIGGNVGGDARVAGGTVTVSGTVAEDLVVTGGQAAVVPSGSVGEDVIAGTGRLAIDGTVSGSLTASTGSYQKSGTVGGTEDVRITREAQPTAPVERSLADRALDAVRHFVVVFLAGMILLWLAPRAYASATSAIQQRPLPAAGWGLIGLLGYVVLLFVILLAMVLLAVVLGILGFGDLVGLEVLGGTVAILGTTLAFVVVSAYVADAIVGAALAGLLMRGDLATRSREAAVLAVGAAVVVVLSAIPVIGPWIKVVVVLLGLGAVLMTFLARWRAQRPPAQPTVVPTPSA